MHVYLYIRIPYTTTSYSHKEVEEIYEEIDNIIIISSKAHYNIVMENFNAKVGPGEIREQAHTV